MIKIDVEGAEELVIAGMNALLQEEDFNADIVLEITPEDLSQSPEELLRPFTEKGYKVIPIPNGQLLRHYFRPEQPINWTPVAPSSVTNMMDVLLTRKLP